MTRQEEIREGLTQRIMKPLDFVNLEETFPEMTIPRLILEYLHSQGVVLKVERELPIEKIYYVEFGHYEDTMWIPFKTQKANFEELV